MMGGNGPIVRVRDVQEGSPGGSWRTFSYVSSLHTAEQVASPAYWQGLPNDLLEPGDRIECLLCHTDGSVSALTMICTAVFNKYGRINQPLRMWQQEHRADQAVDTLTRTLGAELQLLSGPVRLMPLAAQPPRAVENETPARDGSGKFLSKRAAAA
jgi:hypothetical protein